MDVVKELVPWLLATVICALILSKIINYIGIRQATRKNDCLPPPKYPHRDPFLGLDLFFDQFKAMKRGDTAKTERERFRRYGKTFEANSWGTKCIHTMEAENVQAVLAQKFDCFGVEPMRLHVGEPFIGKGVFSTDGAYWRLSRELIKPIFARAQIADFSAIDIHLNRMLKRIPRDGSTIDIQALFKYMFLDYSTKTIFGEATEMLLAESPEMHSNDLLATFDAALRGLGKRILLGRLRILFLWDRTYNQLSKKVHVVIDQYIDKAFSRSAKRDSEATTIDASQRHIMLDELVDVLSDKREIRNQITNIFLPARDATAIGLSGVLFLIARQPQIWQKLRAEALSVEDPITHEVLKSLQYLKSVLNESFRLLMPANRNMRLCLKDCTIPTGGGADGKSPIFVPRGTQVSVNFGAMQRDRDIWGEDAEEFRPERWENVKLGWHYIPFSGGPRVCPGQQLALAECSFVLFRLLREFERIENRDPVREYVEQSRLTTESRNGVKIAFMLQRYDGSVHRRVGL